MKFSIFAICIFTTTICANERTFDVVSSSAEQIADLAQDDSNLIGGVVSPLSGQIYLRVTDLVAKGAESIPLHRIYLPPALRNPISKPSSKSQSFADEHEYNLHLQREYKGWTLYPHCFLKLSGSEAKISDPSGATLDFRFVGQKGVLNSSYGISNLAGEDCSGRHDPRNTQVTFEGNEILVIAPDGTKRFYEKMNPEFFRLRKEILPNGKILRYQYNAPYLLSKIESLDPQEKHCYAALNFEGSLLSNESSTVATQSGDIAFYFGRKPGRNGEFHKKNQTFSYELGFPPVLSSAKTPSYSNETIGYERDFGLTGFNGKNRVFTCSYKLSPDSIYRVDTLSLPVGENDALVSLYQITYNPPVTGAKEGSTTVLRADGIKIVYSFSKSLLLESVRWFQPNGVLAKEKVYDWDEGQRLKRVLWKYGDGNLFCSKTYQHDRFGNPEVETLEGDLTGEGDLQKSTIRRKFSEDGKHLLLREEHEEGKVFVYRYFKDTNLPSSKTTYFGSQFVCQESWDYDESYNLIEYAKDDQTSQKTIIRYRLSQNPASLHRPEWIEELYSDGSQERLLQKTHLSYDKRGNVELEKVTDADGVFCYEIARETNSQGNVLWETNPLGQKNKKEYDLRGRLTNSSNFSGRLQEVKTLDKQGRLKKLEEIADDGTVHTTVHEYDLLDRCTKTIDYLGNVTTYEIDPLTGETCISIGPFGDLTKSSYDSFGRKSIHIDPLGNETTYTYNSYGSLTTIAYADSGKETYRYFKSGALRSHTNLDGLTIQYQRDVFDRPTKKLYLEEDKILAAETFSYTAYQLKSHTDKENHTTTYEYDFSGRKISETAEKKITLYAYDSLGRLSFVNHSDQFYTHYKRDWLDRVLEENKTNEYDKVLWKKKYTYDSDGNLEITTTYPNNRIAEEKLFHDAFGRKILHINAEGCQTKTCYTKQEKNLVKTTTDPNGIQTITKYDAYGRETFLQIGSDHPKIQTFDLAGNLLQIQEGKTMTHYSYDNCNRIKTMTRGFGTLDARRAAYTYEKSGRLSTKKAPDGLILFYTHSPFGDLQSITSSDGTLRQTFRHNLNGELVFADDNGHTIERTVDRLGHILTETIDQKLTLTKTYDPLGRLSTMTLPDQSLIKYTYESLHLKTVDRFSPKGEKLFSHTYQTYDLSSRPLEQSLIHDLGAVSQSYLPSGRPESFKTPFFEQRLTYEPNGRISTISSDGAYTYTDRSELQTEPAHTYGYDHHHNRIQIDGATISHNTLDEIISSQIQYDLRGNLIQNGAFTYHYDPLNRLVQASSQDTTTFTYDALGRCISKTHQSLSEYYLYHQTEELASFHPNGTLKELKVPGLSLKPVAIELQGQSFAPILDYRGNVRRLVSQSAEIADRYDYTAFGTILSLPSTANPWRYSAKRFDSHLNLYDFGKRFYDPALARWLTTDPAGFVDGTNLYAYVLNNPLLYLDRDGQFLQFAIPLIIWGVEFALPSIATIVMSTTAIAAAGAVAWIGPKIVDSLNDRYAYWKNTDVYVPDRFLPQDKRTSEPVPDTDAPHTQLGKQEGRKGEYPQAREFDGSGLPVKDIDFTDHGRPDNHPNPHQHERKPNPTGGTRSRDPKGKPLPGWNYR